MLKVLNNLDHGVEPPTEACHNAADRQKDSLSYQIITNHKQWLLLLFIFLLLQCPCEVI